MPTLLKIAIAIACLVVAVQCFRSAYWQWRHRKTLSFGGARSDAEPAEGSPGLWKLSIVMLGIAGLFMCLLALAYPWID